MTTKRWTRGVAAAAAFGSVVAIALPASGAPPCTNCGPSTVTDPYVVPIPASGVSIESILTVDDAGSATNGYEMVGIPDGAGGWQKGNQIVLNVNHELGATVGIARAHGQKGAFVSRLVVDPVTHEVVEGSDLATSVQYWNPLWGRFSKLAAGTPGNGAAFARLCAGTTVTKGLFYNGTTGNGVNHPIHLAGEETGAEGRAFAFFPDGKVSELPWLGRMSWENVIPADNSSDTTVVMGTDDSNPGRLALYHGTKTNVGNNLAKAGLEGGTLNSIVLGGAGAGVTTDAGFRAAVDVGTQVPFTLTSINAFQTGAQQNAESAAEGGLTLNRIEDGHWDPQNPNDFYFLTTEGGEGIGGGGGGGLWRLSMTDVENPALGGTLELLLDGSELITLNKPDNMGIDNQGNLLIQEDPGNADAAARIVAYRISDGATGNVAQFDPDLFEPATAGANLVTKDEESSGIFSAKGLLPKGYWVFDAQLHGATGVTPGTGPDTVEEYVERGQMLVMRITDWDPIYGLVE